jgi:hypothetical protein
VAGEGLGVGAMATGKEVLRDLEADPLRRKGFGAKAPRGGRAGWARKRLASAQPGAALPEPGAAGRVTAGVVRVRSPEVELPWGKLPRDPMEVSTGLIGWQTGAPGGRVGG